MSHHKFTAVFSAAFLSLSLLTVTTQSAAAATYEVSTLSGQGGAGEFNQPRGLSVAPNGEVYIADPNNFAIKKISTNGVVSVFATTTVRDDGWVDESFCSVYAAYDEYDIWASNCNNTKVYRYQRGNLVRTYTVTRPYTSTNGNGFDWGGGLVVDRYGGIFLSDEGNHVILRIDSLTGTTTVHAGTPGATGGNSDAGKGLFNVPRGLALDSKNNLFVVDTWNNSVRKITPKGEVSTIQTGLSVPVGVAVDSSDSVFVVSESWGGSTITKIGIGVIFNESSTKYNSKFFGGIVGAPSFNSNGGFSIDSRSIKPTNNLYITDHLNHSVKVYSPTGAFIQKFGSQDGFGVTAPGSPNQIYMWPNQTFPLPDGTYLVLDDYTIRHISESGEVLKVTRLDVWCPGTNGAMFTPDGTFFCSYGNYIEVRFPDGTKTRIGNATLGRADGNAASARFNRPEGMALYKGSIYLADMGNGQIRKITPVAGTKDFQVTTVLGTGTWVAGGDFMGRGRANFASPNKIAIDSNGNLYIADGGVDSIYRTSVAQDTDVTRVARGMNSWTSSMVVDGNGVVYIAGWGGKIFTIENNKLTYFTGSGLGNKLGNTDSARFNRPTGLSIDRKGQLIIADRDNHSIKKIAINTAPNSNISIPTSAYSSYLSATSPISVGLTTKSEKEITDTINLTFKTGLVNRIYQGTGNSLSIDTAGLNLCSVSRMATVELESISRPIFEGNGCNNRKYLVTYNGFITWPGSGMQSRPIYASSLGAVLMKINGQTVIDKQSEQGGAKSWPYDITSTISLQGGKQYPIEIWYFRNQPSAQDSASLKLFWSPAPSSRSTTEAIDEKYFSLTKSESDNLVGTPISPTRPSISVNLNFINIKVRVPDNATSIILFAPELGVSKAQPLIGKVKDGFASFEVALSSKFAGKKGIFQILSQNASGDSKPLTVPVTVPKPVTKPAPVVKVLPKTRVDTTQTKVLCKKVGQPNRGFDGGCPPGWDRV